MVPSVCLHYHTSVHLHDKCLFSRISRRETEGNKIKHPDKMSAKRDKFTTALLVKNSSFAKLIECGSCHVKWSQQSVGGRQSVRTRYNNINRSGQYCSINKNYFPLKKIPAHMNVGKARLFWQEVRELKLCPSAGLAKTFNGCRIQLNIFAIQKKKKKQD